MKVWPARIVSSNHQWPWIDQGAHRHRVASRESQGKVEKTTGSAAHAYCDTRMMCVCTYVRTYVRVCVCVHRGVHISGSSSRACLAALVSVLDQRHGISE